MKVCTYNVNGLRSALDKGFLSWLEHVQPDVLCLQEVRALSSELPLDAFEALGYQTHFAPAEKRGYSGVAIFTRLVVDELQIGCGIEAYDKEGRILFFRSGTLGIVSVYIPSGSRDEARQAFKMRFLGDFTNYVDALRKQHEHLLICGDFNICHQAIDIHDPISNKRSPGFLPEERAWLDSFLDSGFVDAFRHVCPEPHHYTWWSFRARARARNLGWRIDYHMITPTLAQALKRCLILPEVHYSDHCPVLLEI